MNAVVFDAIHLHEVLAKQTSKALTHTTIHHAPDQGSVQLRSFPGSNNAQRMLHFFSSSFLYISAMFSLTFEHDVFRCL
jgi:hypothetical protein